MNVLHNSISFYSRANDSTSAETIPVDIFLENIRKGVYEDAVNKVRTAKTKEEIESAKKRLPGVTISGRFSERQDLKIIKHSGLISIDIDKEGLPEGLTPEETKSLLVPDKYVQAAFVSVSGTGLCVLFRVNPEKHREAFTGIGEYLLKHYKIVIDSTSINPSRLRFVSFDPFLYLNHDTAAKFTDYPKIKEPKKQKEFVYTGDDFAEILNQIVQGAINITQDSYFVWLRLGFAIAHKFGEAGLQHFHTVSAYSAKYDPQVTDKQYRNCLRHNQFSIHGKPITISTFYYYAKEAGLQIYSERTKTIVRAAEQGKKAGLNASDISKNLKRFEGVEGDDVKEIVQHAITNNIISEDETVVEQVEMFIRQNYSLRRNEITRYIENNGVPLQQKDLNTIFIKIKKLFPKVPYEIVDRLINSDFVQQYNPFIEWFREHLPEVTAQNHSHGYDQNATTVNSEAIPPIGKTALEVAETNTHGGTGAIAAMLGVITAVPRPGTPEFQTLYPTIAGFFSTISGSDPAYILYFGTKWLVGAISAIFGEHSPLVLVLCGEKQNTGKTQFFRRMLPKALKKYYAESKLDAGKDDEILMTQKWFIMDDEMSGKSKRENDKLKDLTSKQTFSLREPYGRNNVDLNRLAVLCGTTNNNEILNDPTGNRRFIPIHVEEIDKDGYNRIDKTELFLEAYRLYKSGFAWELNTEDIAYLGTDKEMFEVAISEAELILKYFTPAAAGEYCQKLTATDIKDYIEQLTKQRLSLDKIGKQLKRIGFSQEHKKIGRVSSRVYLLHYNNREQPTQEQQEVKTIRPKNLPF